jgi:hypothetical protein
VCFTAPAGWRSTMPKGRRRKKIARPLRNSASRRPRRETASGYRPQPFPGA